MQEIRISEFAPYVGENAIRNVDDPALSVMTVPVAQDAAAPVEPEPELGVPEPISVNQTPEGPTRFVVHVALPAGMWTVSPFMTSATHAATSDSEAEAAV